MTPIQAPANGPAGPEQAISPIFIGGVPRSGTTLVRVILDSHPHIHCGTELRAIHALANLWATTDQTARSMLSEHYAMPPEAVREVFADLIRGFLEPAWRASGKPRVAEKTPSNLLAFAHLHALFPRSPLIHVIRDGRDVVASRLERDLDGASGPIDTVKLARLRAQEWVDAMKLRQALSRRPGPGHCYYEVRYEALVRQPVDVLGRLFSYLGEPFDPRVLDFHRTARHVTGTEEWSAEAIRKPIFAESAGRWRHTLGTAEQEAVLDVAGATLRALGYETQHE